MGRKILFQDLKVGELMMSGYELYVNNIVLLINR